MKGTLKGAYSITYSYEDTLEIGLKAGNKDYIKSVEIMDIFGDLIVLIWLKNNNEFEIGKGYLSQLEKIFLNEQTLEL